MSEHTHRVVGKSHRRSAGMPEEDGANGEPYVEYEVGDEITPTESELESFPFRFEELTDTSDESDGSGDDESADDDGPTVDDIEDADYRELQSFATEFDDIRGDWGEDRLRSELRDAVEG